MLNDEQKIKQMHQQIDNISSKIWTISSFNNIIFSAKNHRLSRDTTFLSVLDVGLKLKLIQFQSTQLLHPCPREYQEETAFPVNMYQFIATKSFIKHP